MSVTDEAGTECRIVRQTWNRYINNFCTWLLKSACILGVILFCFLSFFAIVTYPQKDDILKKWLQYWKICRGVLVQNWEEDLSSFYLVGARGHFLREKRPEPKDFSPPPPLLIAETNKALDLYLHSYTHLYETVLNYVKEIIGT
jgi:hypothetical protein